MLTSRNSQISVLIDLQLPYLRQKNSSSLLGSTTGFFELVVPSPTSTIRQLSKYDISSKPYLIAEPNNTKMHPTLYINPLSPEITFSVFLDDEKTINYSLIKNLDNATTFPKMLIEIIDTHSIREIWCVT